MSDLSMLIGSLLVSQKPKKQSVETKTFQPGDKVGRATLIRKVPAPDTVKSAMARHHTYWECRCECGALFVRRNDSLRGNDNPTCSIKCKYSNHPSSSSVRVKDLTGKRFGYLVVTGRGERTRSWQGVMWNYVCDCGNTGSRRANMLNFKGDRQCCSRGCPCLRKDWVPSVG